MPRHVGSIDSQAVGIKTAIGAPKRGVALSEQVSGKRHDHRESFCTILGPAQNTDVSVRDLMTVFVYVFVYQKRKRERERERERERDSLIM